MCDFTVNVKHFLSYERCVAGCVLHDHLPVPRPPDPTCPRGDASRLPQRHPLLSNPDLEQAVESVRKSNTFYYCEWSQCRKFCHNSQLCMESNVSFVTISVL